MFRSASAECIPETLTRNNCMKILIVEDDFSSRTILLKILSKYGECHVAVNGKEAVQAFTLALDSSDPYKLVCLDVMMPELDGQAVLKQIKELEASRGISLGDTEKSTHIVMTTGLDDAKNLMQSMRNGCEAYLQKPIDRKRLISTLQNIGLVLS